ncbi:MAG: 3-oxoacyl-[acyl-carrier-protein] reductase FabG [Candidatus Omnitrophica bacterium]|nr:3-oxoacyl-[acyl-carrier-protein] reductase FabG [Candidatus Omnitrophota bacterium]
MSMKRLESRTALVTGGSRGIGAAIVRRLWSEGAKVHFTYRAAEDQAREVIASCGGAVSASALDVTDAVACEAVVDEATEKLGGLDIVVNNAGIIRDGLFLSMEDTDWAEVIETNLGGVFRICRAACRQMLMQGGGSIVNVSSIVGELGGVGQANYAASKGALNALTRSLAAELGPKGVRVNAVAPGMVRTDMTGAVRAVAAEKILERIPLGRFAEPEEIASAVAFLASDDAKYLTGQVVTVDGGLSLLGRR